MVECNHLNYYVRYKINSICSTKWEKGTNYLDTDLSKPVEPVHVSYSSLKDFILQNYITQQLIFSSSYVKNVNVTNLRFHFSHLQIPEQGIFSPALNCSGYDDKNSTHTTNDPSRGK